MKKNNYRQPETTVIVTDYHGVLCVSGPNSLGGYIEDVTLDYGDDD